MISPEKERELIEKMERLGIKQSDIHRALRAFGRPRRPEREQSVDLRLSEACTYGHRGEVPAGKIPGSQPVLRPKTPCTEDRENDARKGERRAAAHREDQEAEKTPFEAGEGEGTRTKAYPVTKEEGAGETRYLGVLKAPVPCLASGPIAGCAPFFPAGI